MKGSRPEQFRWMGSAGRGTESGLREFQDNWQRPFQAAFSDKVCIDEARLVQGERMAAFGHGWESFDRAERTPLKPIAKA